MAEIRLTLQEEEIELLAGRAAYWPARKTLVVADLHWGKAETFQHWGSPVPSGVLESDLARLEALAQAKGASRVLVLGDLIHARVGLSAGVKGRVAEFFERSGLSLTLVRGNHDRSLKEIPAGWRMEVVEGFLDGGPFRFRHDDGEGEGKFQWLGHIHPLWVARGGGDRLRLPCFWLQQGAMTLPAFSEFTAGINVNAGKNDRIFVIAEDSVLEVPAAPSSQRLLRT